MHLSTIQRLQWAWVEKVKWHNKTPLEAIALIGSEVGEAANECRGATPTAELPGELADVILRVVDLAEDLGYDMEAEIKARMDRNEMLGRKGREK